MRDKRPVDELSIDELERILAIRKREARQAQARLTRYEARRITTPGSAPIAEAEIPAVEDAQVAGVRFDDDPEPAPSQTIQNGTQGEPPASQRDVPYTPEPRFEDEIKPRVRKPQAIARSPRTIFWNRALLAVEVAAVFGMVVLLVALFASVQSITQTTNQIQADSQGTLIALQVPPTATPTINMAKIVLPGGHRYDSQTDSARLNLEEVPSQYRDAFQQAALTTISDTPPIASPQGPLNVRIPAISVQSPVVTGDGWQELQRGVGHNIGSANPGERGNLVLTAHNDVFGEIFRDLEKLQPGDKIYVTTQSREYTYIVRGKEVVLPTETRVLDNTQRNIAQITLITCYPYRIDSHRMIITGELVPNG